MKSRAFLFQVAAVPESTEQETSTSEGGTEERILEAALIVFSMKGRDGARMQEIADLAGINKALLHYYFRSKVGLYEKVFEYVIAKLVVAFGTSLADAASFNQLLRLFIDRYIDFVASNLPVVRLMVTEHLAGEDRLPRKLKSMIESAGSPPRVFIDSLSAAADRGEIRRVDPHQMLITVISCCVFSFVIFPTVEAIMTLAKNDRQAFVEQRKKHVYDVISTALRPGAAIDDRFPSPKTRID